MDRTKIERLSPYYLALLREYAEKQKGLNPSWSIRGWARALGFEYAGTLANILNGNRIPSVETSKKLMEGLELGEYERSRWQRSLALARSVTSDEERPPKKSSRRKKTRRFTVREVDALVSLDAYLIFDAIAFDDFVESHEWMRDRFRCSISKSAFEATIEIFIRKKIIGRDTTGRLTKLVDYFDAPSRQESEALKRFHSDCLRLVSSLVRGLRASERQLLASTLLISESLYPEICYEIEAFRNHLTKTYDGSGSDQILLFSSQLSPMAKKD